MRWAEGFMLCVGLGKPAHHLLLLTAFLGQTVASQSHMSQAGASANYGMQPLHHACQKHARDLGVLGLRWVPCRSDIMGRELIVVEGGKNDALHDALVTGKTSFTRQEFIALRVTPEVTEDTFIRVGKGSGALASVCYQPQTPIACLLETYRPMCAIMDENGMLPLHYAAKNGASSLVIRRLLEAEPKAASILSFSKRLPLHWGAEGRVAPETLRLLIAAYPAGVNMEDSRGCTPRDLAASGVQSMLQ